MNVATPRKFNAIPHTMKYLSSSSLKIILKAIIKINEHNPIEQAPGNNIADDIIVVVVSPCVVVKLYYYYSFQYFPVDNSSAI